MKESNSLSPSRCGPACLYRRSGLLSTVLFDRSGDRYIVSRVARNEAIDSVLWFRRQALDWYCLAEDAILPSRVHSDALQRFQRWFQRSRLAERANDSNERQMRNYTSQLRVALFEAYGGAEWMNLLLAVGARGINSDLVECYNDEIDFRTSGGAHGEGPCLGPRLSARSLAAAQGQPLPEVRGVQQTRTAAYSARMSARRLDRQVQSATHQ